MNIATAYAPSICLAYADPVTGQKKELFTDAEDSPAKVLRSTTSSSIRQQRLWLAAWERPGKFAKRLFNQS